MWLLFLFASSRWAFAIWASSSRVTTLWVLWSLSLYDWYQNIICPANTAVSKKQKHITISSHQACVFSCTVLLFWSYLRNTPLLLWIFNKISISKKRKNSRGPALMYVLCVSPHILPSLNLYQQNQLWKAITFSCTVTFLKFVWNFEE